MPCRTLAPRLSEVTRLPQAKDLLHKPKLASHRTD